MMESDFISRWRAQDAMTGENLIRNLDSVENGDAKRYARAAIRVLEQLEPADVRFIVCCKDCIHWKHNPGTNRMYCSVWDWINSSTGEDYCSFAERRLEKMEGVEQTDLFPELSRFQKWKNKLTAKIIKTLKRRR